MAVFQKEAEVLARVQSALEAEGRPGGDVGRAVNDLVRGFARLLRQSNRMASMGDRIQGALNALNCELKASEAKYRGVFENVTEGIYRSSPEGVFIEVNLSMAAMFGFVDGAAFLRAAPEIRALFCEPDDYARYESLLEADGVHRMEVRVCGPDDCCRWVAVSAGVVREAGESEGPTVVGVFADVTERRNMLEEMCRLARTDGLTGLWNRRYFMELAAREVARSGRTGAPLSLLILDVDFFKNVNDMHGHDVGDRVLVGLADVLRGSVREVDVVGRYGGEEFVVLLPDTPAREGCRVAGRIAEAVRARPLTDGDPAVRLTVSIGMAPLESGDDLDTVLKFADIALYAAKKNGRDRVERYRRGAKGRELAPACGGGELPGEE